MAAGSGGYDLYEFLVEAELQHYFSSFQGLKVHTVQQLKYVVDSDLENMGMTRPEVRRLKKFYRKQCPQGTFSKLKRMITTSTSKDGGSHVPVVPAGGLSTATSTSPSAQSVPHQGGSYMVQEDALSLLQTLGAGEFGAVHQGVWVTQDKKRVQVAVKVISPDRLQAGRSEFLKEATLMHGLQHDSLVRLYGVALTKGDRVMMVSELAPLRSLLECLKDPMLRPNFTVWRLHGFAIQICDAMTYLEGRQLVHRDLAARNVLVFSKDKVKVSDFGLTRALGVGKEYYRTNFNVNLKLPIAWCAPECISDFEFSTASDVWAFGVTLWEMFTYGFQPWAGFTGQQILAAVEEPECRHLEQPESCPLHTYSLLRHCWRYTPAKRPKFSALLVKLSTGRPERRQAVTDCGWLEGQNEYLYYRARDVITVLDSEPEDPPDTGLGRGVLANGQTGYYRKSETSPYIEVTALPTSSQPKAATLRGSEKLLRKESSRKTKTGKRLNASMISQPANDLRHTGHIGYDGAVFGDVSFVGDTSVALPVKGSPKTNGGLSASAASLPKSESDGEVLSTRSEAGLIDQSPRLIQSFTAFTAATEHSLKSSDGDSLDFASNEPDFEDLDAFKMPDLSSDTFNFGSLMDEVMGAFDSSDKRDSPSSTPSHTPPRHCPAHTPPRHSPAHTPPRHSPTPGLATVATEEPALSDDTSPLIDGQNSFQNGGLNGSGSLGGKISFDNVAMNDSDSMQGDSVTRVHRDSGSSSRSCGSSTDSPSNGAQGSLKKKKKPKLRIDGAEDDGEEFIPGSNRSSQRSGVRSLSESEERKMDEAIALANAYAIQSTSGQMISPGGRNSYATANGNNGHVMSPRSPTKQKSSPRESLSDQNNGDSDCNSSMNSQKFRSLLGGSKKKKSPKQETKSYTEEIANISDVSEVSPEAQEAYNMLIVRGSIKEKDGASRRDQRLQRSREHARNSSPGATSGSSTPQVPERPLSTLTHNSSSSAAHSTTLLGGSSSIAFSAARNTRNHNQNIRAPQGIPRPAPRAALTRDQDEKDDEVHPEEDVNPLRRLREVSAIIPPRSTSSAARFPLDSRLDKMGPATAPKPTRLSSTGAATTAAATSAESPRRDSNPRPTAEDDAEEGNTINCIPLPPPRVNRNSSSDQSRPPRQRKYPLDLSQYRSYPANCDENGVHRASSFEPSQQQQQTRTSSSSFRTRALPPEPRCDDEGDELNKSRDSEDSVFSVTSHSSSDGQRRRTIGQCPNTASYRGGGDAHSANSYRMTPSPVQSTNQNAQFSVKSVKLTARDLGYLDTSDMFWSKEVSSLQSVNGSPSRDDRLSSGSDFSTGSASIRQPIPGRYKTSDTVSYEDLLDFALDGVSDRESEVDICDEVRLMRRVLTKDVTIEDCMYALEETHWDVNSAIKLIKLKQLLSTKLADSERCKHVLLTCQWDVPEAADYLLRTSPGQDSPELVHV